MKDTQELRVLVVKLADGGRQEVEADWIEITEQGVLYLTREEKLVAVFAAGMWQSCARWQEQKPRINAYY
jgi:hypothetical protein